MRKYIVGFLLLIGSFAFALTISDLTNKLEKVKTIYLAQTGYFNTIQQDVLSKIEDFYKKLEKDKDLQILIEVGKFKLPDLKQSFISDLLDLKSKFISDVSDLNGQIQVLDDKIEYGLLTGDDVDQQIATIDFKIESLSGLYINLLTDLKNKYLEKLNQLSGDIQKTKEENAGFLNFIKKREEKLNKILAKYKEMKLVLDRFLSLFLANQDDLYEFLNQKEQYFEDKLTQILSGYLAKLYEKNPALKYCAGGQLSDYIKVLVNSFIVELEKYFKQLIGIPYSEEDVKYVEDVINTIKQKYFEGEKINYKALAEDDYLDKIYDKLLAKIDEIEKAINDKLAFYNFPDTEKQIKEKIFESLKEFLENKLNDLLEDFKQYISDKEQICELKVKEEKQKVNEILDKYYNIYVLTGQDILNYIENLQKEIQQILPTLILPENKNLLQKIYWQLEIKKIDELIKNQNLDRFDIKYPDIEQTIYEIIESIAEEYKKKGKEDVLKQKLERAIEKIDNLLENVELADETKYLLLKIKKVFIKYLYLNNEE